MLLREGEAACELGVTRCDLTGLIAAGEIRTVAVGGEPRVPTSELRRWVRENMRAASVAAHAPAGIGERRARPEAASLKKVYENARDRAKRRQEPFGLSYADYRQIVARAEGRCEVTGIPFDWAPAGGRRRPFAASLDRVDCDLLYTPENCRLVIVALNYALNEWGMDVFAKMAAAYIARQPT